MSPLNWIAAIVWWLATVIQLYGFKDSDMTWYEQRSKNAHKRPVKWIFGAVWLFVFTLNSIAIFLYWRDHQHSSHYTTTLAIYLVNAFLCKTWGWLFFGQRDPLTAMITVLCILGTGATVMALFFVAHAITSGCLFIPFVALCTLGLYMSWLFYNGGDHTTLYHIAHLDEPRQAAKDDESIML